MGGNFLPDPSNQLPLPDLVLQQCQSLLVQLDPEQQRRVLDQLRDRFSPLDPSPLSGWQAAQRAAQQQAMQDAFGYANPYVYGAGTIAPFFMSASTSRYEPVNVMITSAFGIRFPQMGVVLPDPAVNETVAEPMAPNTKRWSGPDPFDAETVLLGMPRKRLDPTPLE